MARRTKTLAEQLAELDNPAPKDFDPEEEPPQDDSEQDVSEDDNTAAAREHYVDVGKSKLRKRDVVPLGPRYEGARISRDAATGEDEDEDDPFSKGFDEEESEDDVEDAAELSASEGEDEDVSDEDEDMRDGDESPATDMSDEDDDDEEENDDDEEEDDDDEEAEDKTELRKMMAEEQKTVAASLSQAAKQDAEKGRAVKTQRTTFDSLLNARIKLQKALIGTNTLTGVISDPAASADDTQDAFLAAETAAFTLWSTLNSLRETLESSRTGHKRKHASYTLDTPTEDLWNHMRSQELSAAPSRASVLEKWNQKARGASAITPKNKLNNSSANQSIVDVLQEQLHGDRLTKRARTPRSCAPLQLAAAASTTSESSPIYDDADFYGLLLQSLLEQRSADSIAASASSSVSLSLPTGFQMRREAKTKKNIDTKASKGRKMRYTVHEKLQNFMAVEDRSTWAERAADELFGSLFGARMGLGEDDEDNEVQEQEDEGEEAGLMMFRS
ncbi:TRAUB-domain-containing protein [Aureobasidium namibiae CBS 147.97]|uniref:Protein BFR2 n=1 Tax=Aureobasidium namibiae CBS 147.97 TaxID=1043004 RepID=A0A074WRJ2_9PEZI